MEAASIAIIDTHIHLFDPARPQGIPWPPKDNPVLYKPALPARYRGIAAPLGIKGAIEVEASPWLEDNQWVLDQAANNPIILGMVGNLEIGKPDFRQNFDRFHKNPLFLGIRCGNLWDRDLGTDMKNPEAIANLKTLADAELELDIANPTPALLADVLRLKDRIPNLRIVLDHLPQIELPTGVLRELGKRPQIYAKVSEVLRRENGQVPMELSFYKPRLDELYEIFGQDRLMYGSDWPNSDIWATYPEVLKITRAYFADKGPAVAAKIFHKNSQAAYRWKKRSSSS